MAKKPAFHSSQKGFTLAEILIVVSIIGLIAGVTIPNVITNVKKYTTVTKLEKTYSNLANVIRRSEVDNGPLANWAFNEASNPAVSATRDFFEAYLKPYLAISKTCPDGLDATCGMPLSSSGVNYILADGVSISIRANKTILYILVDLNNSQKPNEMGLDAFFFTITQSGGLVPYSYTKGMTREQIKDNGTNKCNDTATSTSRYMCTALIYYDGWRMLDDYPWKN